MNSLLTKRLEQLQESGGTSFLTSPTHGLEKEGLRVDKSGKIALTPHPGGLGSSLTNGFITTDFSESLLELITPVIADPADAIDYLTAVHQYIYTHLDNEIIWAASMPCRVDDPSIIPIARFGSSNLGQMKHIYRRGLAHRYGKMMQSIAGIHFNFSLPDSFFETYQKLVGNLEPYQDFKSSAYFAMIRNFRRYSWMLLYLFGASPALSRSFLGGDAKNLESLGDDTLYLPYATSLRMSDIGYSNSAQSSLGICFNKLSTYTKTLREATRTPHPDHKKIGVIREGEYQQLSDTILQIENEYYSDIRPKRVPKEGESALQALNRGGVEYVEVRNTDVNPLLPVGIDLDQALFLDVFLITCLIMDDKIVSKEECKVIADNQLKVATRGREPNLMLSSVKGEIELKPAAYRLLEQFTLVAQMLDYAERGSRYSMAVQQQVEKVDYPSFTPSAQILQSIKSSELDYHEWVLEMSKNHKETLKTLPGDKEIFDRLEKESRESVIEQREIEDSDTIDFATFLGMYRTAPATGDE